MTSTSTVFVYHAQDHEGALLADFLREQDEEHRFEFLALSSEEEMEHNADFLKRSGIHGSVRLPYVIIVPHGQERIIVHGPRFHDWMAQLIDALYDQDPSATQAICHRLFPLHLGPPLLRLLSLLVMTPPIQTEDLSTPTGASGASGASGAQPNAPQVKPSPTAGTTIRPDTTRQTGGRVIKEQAHSSLQYVLDADMEDDTLVDSSVPGPAGAESKAVNVAAVIAAEGRQRERQQQYNVDEMRKD